MSQKRASLLPQEGEIDLESSIGPEAFRERVRRAKSYIREGDVIQVVLSRRFETRKLADEFTIYRALRFINPSPYMFFLRLEGLSLWDHRRGYGAVD